jgi:hypothetical protein
MAIVYDTVDQWLDWGGHTVTVDPIGNSAWIHEGQDGKHAGTVERGRANDAADTKHLMSLLAKETVQAFRGFLPSVDDLEKMPHYQSRPCDRIFKRDADEFGLLSTGEWVLSGPGDCRGKGRLPVISQHIRDGLKSVPSYDIERQMYSSASQSRSDVFARDGTPDHGIA